MKRILVPIMFVAGFAVFLSVGATSIFTAIYWLLSLYLLKGAFTVSFILTLLILISIAFWLKRIVSPSKKKSNLLCLSNLSKGANFIGDVVFVHGMDGDAKKTWGVASGKPSWVKFLSQDRPDLCVWSFDYPASSLSWFGSGMQLHSRAENFLTQLGNKNFGKRPICFITHSLGGLLVKQLLHEAMVFSADSHKPIADVVRGVVFI